MPMISLPASRNVDQYVGQMVLNLIAENSPGGNVVAVAEAARNAQHLKLRHAMRLFQQRGLRAISP